MSKLTVHAEGGWIPGPPTERGWYWLWDPRQPGAGVEGPAELPVAGLLIFPYDEVSEDPARYLAHMPIVRPRPPGYTLELDAPHTPRRVSVLQNGSSIVWPPAGSPAPRTFSGPSTAPASDDPSE